MIAKKIHYIWLGKNRKPKSFQMVLKSWEKHAGEFGFEIKEWSEENIYEFHLPEYFFYLLKQKKWAFASDVLRVYILQKYEGIYLDIDQVLVKNLDMNFQNKFLSNDLFISKYHEVDDYYGFGFVGCSAKSLLINDLINFYENFDFKNEKKDIIINKIGSEFINKYLEEIKNNEDFGNKILILEQETFYPLTEKNFTENTYSYHLGNTSWVPMWKKILQKIPLYSFFKKTIKRFLPKAVLKKIGFNIDYL
jgi:mannosyltransferase OCH1-like enzyme